ncbi:MAG: hypothetical protein QXF12_08065 [Candidatus Aenigmatarchaeota archaeon]
MNDLERLVVESIKIIEDSISVYISTNTTYLDPVSYFIDVAFNMAPYSRNNSLMLTRISKGTPKVLYALKLSRDNILTGGNGYKPHLNFDRLHYYQQGSDIVLRIINLSAHTKMSLFNFLNNFFEFLYNTMILNKLSIRIDKIETVMRPIIIKKSDIFKIETQARQYIFLKHKFNITP